MQNSLIHKWIRIKEIHALDSDEYFFGKKALGLSWLHKNKFNVPTGYCLSIDKRILSSDSSILGDALKTCVMEFPVIARSSALQEDLATSSMAGKFLSISDIKKDEALKEAILKIALDIFDKCTDTQHAGIVIQKQIQAKYAGALFSSNPINFKKDEALLSVIRGAGAKLLLGKSSGSEYALSYNEHELLSGQIVMTRKLLGQFENYAKKMRRKYPFPSDSEFVIDKNENIWFVQIRPIAEVGPTYNYVSKVGERFEEGPNKEKINLRYFAEKYGLSISAAWKMKVSMQSLLKDIKVLCNHIRSKNLLSLVLLNPSLLNNSIYRKFCNSSLLPNILLDLIAEMKDKFLAMECIVKEVLPAEFTGMIQKSNVGFFIEVAKGHYLPKGIAQLNNYLLDLNYDLIDKNETVQKYSYELTMKGYRQLREDNQFFFTHESLKKIASTFNPILDALPSILEFGIMKNKKLILLDFSEEELSLGANPIKTGIVSKGIHRGKLIKLRSNVQAINLDLHKKDHYVTSSEHPEKVVIWAKRPALHLMRHIEKYGRGNVGFIFSELSLLAHLSINLREMGIPAIWWKGDVKPYVGKEVQIDALHPDLPGEARLSRVDEQRGKYCAHKK